MLQVGSIIESTVNVICRQSWHAQDKKTRKNSVTPMGELHSIEDVAIQCFFGENIAVRHLHRDFNWIRLLMGREKVRKNFTVNKHTLGAQFFVKNLRLYYTKHKITLILTDVPTLHLQFACYE